MLWHESHTICSSYCAVALCVHGTGAASAVNQHCVSAASVLQKRLEREQSQSCIRGEVWGAGAEWEQRQWVICVSCKELCVSVWKHVWEHTIKILNWVLFEALCLWQICASQYIWFSPSQHLVLSLWFCNCLCTYCCPCGVQFGQVANSSEMKIMYIIQQCETVRSWWCCMERDVH